MVSKFKIRKGADGNWHICIRRDYYGNAWVFDWEHITSVSTWEVAMYFVGIDVHS